MEEVRQLGDALHCPGGDEKKPFWTKGQVNGRRGPYTSLTVGYSDGQGQGVRGSPTLTSSVADTLSTETQASSRRRKAASTCRETTPQPGCISHCRICKRQVPFSYHCVRIVPLLSCQYLQCQLLCSCIRNLCSEDLQVLCRQLTEDSRQISGLRAAPRQCGLSRPYIQFRP